MWQEVWMAVPDVHSLESRGGWTPLVGSVFFQNTMHTQQAVFTIVGLQFLVVMVIGILFAGWEAPGQSGSGGGGALENRSTGGCAEA